MLVGRVVLGHWHVFGMTSVSGHFEFVPGMSCVVRRRFNLFRIAQTYDYFCLSD